MHGTWRAAHGEAHGARRMADCAQRTAHSACVHAHVECSKTCPRCPPLEAGGTKRAIATCSEPSPAKLPHLNICPSALDGWAPNVGSPASRAVDLGAGVGVPAPAVGPRMLVAPPVPLRAWEGAWPHVFPEVGPTSAVIGAWFGYAQWLWSGSGKKDVVPFLSKRARRVHVHLPACSRAWVQRTFLHVIVPTGATAAARDRALPS